MFWIKKNDFDNRKNKVLKSAKQQDFPKGIIHGFCPNIKFFLIYFIWEKTSQ